MQREFSKELAEDRQFEIGGELFEWPLSPLGGGGGVWDEEVIADEVDGGRADGAGVLLPGRHRVRDQAHPALPRTPERLSQALQDAGSSQDRSRPRHQIVQLYRWLLQVTSGLPTKPPSDSGVWGWRQRRVIRGRILLAGGNPDALTLSDFLDAAYALAVEDHTRINPLQGVEAAAERWLPPRTSASVSRAG